jgi:hypothetical protein
MMKKREEIKRKIKESNGKFFSIKFIKKDGTTREMLCRTDVKKHLKGGENNNPNLGESQIVVYDIQKKGYRTINLDSVFYTSL